MADPKSPHPPRGTPDPGRTPGLAAGGAPPSERAGEKR
jgi:hypothetical protein